MVNVTGSARDVLSFAALVLCIPTLAGDVRGHASWLSVLCFFLIYTCGSLALETFSCSTKKLSETSKKPDEFKNTIVSMANAIALTALFVRACFDAVRAPNGLTDVDAFTEAIRPSIAIVVSLAIGYLAADTLDMYRKNLLNNFIFAHHVGSSFPAIIWLCIDGSHAPLTRAILLIVSCEVNSVILHLRRLMRLTPGASDTAYYKQVDTIFYATLFLFRICTSVTFLCLYAYSLLKAPLDNSVIDWVVLCGLALFTHHNFTIMMRSRATDKARALKTKADAGKKEK